MTLDSKVALVVGAGASGPGMSIGRAVAIEFARRGARVAAVDRDSSSLAETEAAVAEEGGECLPLEADAAEPGEIARAVETCVETFGGIDILHNNVGVMAFGDPETLSLEEWDRVTQVNGRSCFLACKYAVPHLQARSGNIINMSSIAAMRATGASYSAYAASKAAVIGFTRSLAVEYGKRGIRVNCVAPGFVDSPMMRAGLARRLPAHEADRFLEGRARALPLGRLGTPQDVAKACAFIASDDASYITGVTLIVDGGATCVSAG